MALGPSRPRSSWLRRCCCRAGRRGSVGRALLLLLLLLLVLLLVLLSVPHRVCRWSLMQAALL